MPIVWGRRGSVSFPCQSTGPVGRIRRLNSSIWLGGGGISCRLNGQMRLLCVVGFGQAGHVNVPGRLRFHWMHVIVRPLTHASRHFAWHVTLFGVAPAAAYEFFSSRHLFGSSEHTLHDTGSGSHLSSLKRSVESLHSNSPSPPQQHGGM
jgi:hypothetical protein